MRKLFILTLFCSFVVLPFCSVSKKTTTDVNAVSYERDVAPIIAERCSPCHFPDKGKKKFLDTYSAVKTNIDDIIGRIQLDPSKLEFMPFKSKKEPLSDSLIQVIVQWKEGGMGR
ncbi:MAG: hypothetical protein KDC24_04550 [Saprospiraceae bacterium]|nr:hypothetical protein [Saprospiraceae bacterium]